MKKRFFNPRAGDNGSRIAASAFAKTNFTPQPPKLTVAQHNVTRAVSDYRGNAGNIQAIDEAVAKASRWVEPLQREIGRVIVGQQRLIDGLLVALVAKGHLLVEGVPGLAKTLSVKTLAAAIQVKFQRIQFTPDMLPADFVGSMIHNPRRGLFRRKRGPVFSNLILADEINRAPAKVQSALIEAMQDRQVMLGEEMHALPDPFLVVATQNPLAQECVYPLAEAQSDRFMLKIDVDYPNRIEEDAIQDAMATSEPSHTVAPVATGDDIVNARHVVNTIYIDEKVKTYIVDLVRATRAPEAFGMALGEFIRCGASPRATIFLTLTSRASAFLQGRGYVTPQDVKNLALDVLRHRVTVSYEAESEDITSEDLVKEIVATVPVP